MRKYFAVLLTLLLAAPLGAVAFDIPTGGNPTAAKVKSVTKEATKTITTSAINDKLKKENCQFVKGKFDQGCETLKL